MNKILLTTLALGTLLLSSCSQGDTEKFEGSDFSFSYPTGYKLRKAATQFVFEGQDGEPALTFHRYLAETPEEVVTQLQSVGKACDYKSGGKNYGGYRAYSIVQSDDMEGECGMEGSLIDSKDGMFVLFIENDPSANSLERTLKNSFKFN